MGRVTERRGRSVAVLVAGVLAVGGGAVAWSVRPAEHSPAAEARLPLRTAEVTRTDLSDSRELPGTLGYGKPHVLKGTGKGVVTRLPKPGAKAARGKPLYWVDDRPVTALFGDTPLFRPLDKPGVRGRDVTVVAENLRALGYDIGAPDVSGERDAAGEGDELTAALVAAVERWRHDTGAGAPAPGSAVVLPGPVRIEAVTADLGDPADGELLTYTATGKSVTVAMDAVDVGRVGVGDRVTVTLPDDREIPGRVTSVGRVVEGGGTQDEAAQTGPATVTVTVAALHRADVEKVDAAAVRVRFTTTERRGVLAVPVDALVAVREGGYAVQRPGGALVAVKTGMFARGLVEISGKQLVPGMKVVTAS
ncbi:hypothetical protein [Streptomyces canus]|uniref:hypothetical protein n=1 Tax=Streptomyces canus TaxID=58343 RepID=UPI003804DAE0